MRRHVYSGNMCGCSGKAPMLLRKIALGSTPICVALLDASVLLSWQLIENGCTLS